MDRLAQSVRRPWYREPGSWLAMAVPSATLVAGALAIGTAFAVPAVPESASHPLPVSAGRVTLELEALPRPCDLHVDDGIEL